MGLIKAVVGCTALAALAVVEVAQSTMENVLGVDEDEKVTVVDKDTGEEHEVRKCDLDR